MNFLLTKIFTQSTTIKSSMIVINAFFLCTSNTPLKLLFYSNPILSQNFYILNTFHIFHTVDLPLTDSALFPIFKRYPHSHTTYNSSLSCFKSPHFLIVNLTFQATYFSARKHTPNRLKIKTFESCK